MIGKRAAGTPPGVRRNLLVLLVVAVCGEWLGANSAHADFTLRCYDWRDRAPYAARVYVSEGDQFVINLKWNEYSAGRSWVAEWNTQKGSGGTATSDTDYEPRDSNSQTKRTGEEVGVSYVTLRDESFTVSAGDVTGARRIDGRHDLWEITVEPDSRAAVSITLPGNRACGTTGAVCTRGDDPRPLGNSPSATVAGPSATLLTASFGDVPATHAGEEFEFSLTFSEEPEVSYVTLRDHAFDETGGTVRKAKRRTQGSNLSWDITVEPEGTGAVTIELPATSDCGATGAICTGDGRPLSNASSATVAGASTASAQVDGPTLTLSWPTPPDGFAPPGGSDFAVRVDGVLRAVASASFRTSGVALHLSESVQAGQKVVLDYIGSAMHPLRDAAGTPRAPWQDLVATNVTEHVEPQGAAVAPEVTTTVTRLPPAFDGALSASLAGGAIGDAGLSALSGRTELRRLDLSGNALEDISALSGIQALESLDLSGNEVSDLAPLAGLTELRRLDLAGNRIDELWPLGALPKLEVLLLDRNRVADISALTHLGRLENLGLAGNLVEDVSPLGDLWSLRRLDLGGNPVRDVSPVGDLETLVWLRLPSADEEAPTHRLIRLRWLLAPNAAEIASGRREARYRDLAVALEVSLFRWRETNGASP